MLAMRPEIYIRTAFTLLWPLGNLALRQDIERALRSNANSVEA
jgi:hypothetical protein